MVNRDKFEGTSKLTIFKQIIESETEDIKIFIEEISQYIENKQNISEIEIEDNQREYFEDDFYKYNKIFPKLYYNSLLLTIYSLFENWLFRIAKIAYHRSFSKIEIKHLAGNSPLEKSYQYLKLVAEINLSPKDNVWRQLKQIQKVRNAIAHEYSNILKDKSKKIEEQDLYTELLKDSSIELNQDTGYFFITDKKYLYKSINLIAEYLYYIIEQLLSSKVIARNMTMPFDNTVWGQEKSYTLIKQILHCFDILDQFKIRKDDFRESDFTHNLYENLNAMMWNQTKLMSFFYDGEWNINDRDIIMKEKLEGLEKIIEKYKNN